MENDFFRIWLTSKLQNIFWQMVKNIWKSYIWTADKDQLPVGLLAQLVERCTGIAEVMGSNPVQAWFFFSGLIFTTA